jgi:hypothetical protein
MVIPFMRLLTTISSLSAVLIVPFHVGSRTHEQRLLPICRPTKGRMLMQIRGMGL